MVDVLFIKAKVRLEELLSKNPSRDLILECNSYVSSMSVNNIKYCKLLYPLAEHLVEEELGYNDNILTTELVLRLYLYMNEYLDQDEILNANTFDKASIEINRDLDFMGNLISLKD